MSEEQLRKLISEGLRSGISEIGVSAEDQEVDTDEFEDSLGSGMDDYEDDDINLGLEPMPLSSVDMPIQDKAVLNYGGNEPYDDEFSDLNGYKEFGYGNDDYEGNWEDDVSVSPGYFNEGEDENYIDDMGMAKNRALGNYNPMDDAIEYAGGLEDWDSLSALDKQAILVGLERDFEASLNESKNVVKITKDQLQSIIKEGVAKLHKQTLIENRLDAINKELNALNNPQAWEDARTNAQAEFAKKNIAWQEITQREKLTD